MIMAGPFTRSQGRQLTASAMVSPPSEPQFKHSSITLRSTSALSAHSSTSTSSAPIKKLSKPKVLVPKLKLPSNASSTSNQTPLPTPLPNHSKNAPIDLEKGSSRTTATATVLLKKRRTTLQVVTEQTRLILSLEKSQCGFCCMDMKEQEGIMLDTCLHTFCRECLVSAVELQEGAQIGCLIREEAGCNGYLLDKEVEALVSPGVYKTYMERSMALARKDIANVFQCLTPGCDGWCEYELGTKSFLCYICSKTNCLECKAFHEGFDCVSYQNVLKMANLTGKEAKDLMDKERKEANGTGWDQLMDLIQAAAAGQQQDTESVLRSLQETGVFKNTREFECPICMTDIEIGGGVILQDCLHLFCRDCLIGNIEHSDDPQIKCPHIGANHSCTNILKPREIKSLLPAETYERHLLRSVKLAENGMANSYHCKTPDCLGWCELDPVGGNEFDKFKCNICGKNNCLKCKVIHEGVSCEDYKNRLVQNENDILSETAVNDMVAKGECMRCPKCKAVVQKIIGCDWMICSACRTELCWATKGPRWGPQGKGDISAGCKCQYTTGGRKCAPHCQNCH